MRIKVFFLLAALTLLLPSCSQLNSGDSFNLVIDGIEYNFEVIVSKMSYVRLSPVSGATVVKGDIALPSAVGYDGVTYTVTQIGKRAFKNYTGITSVTLPKTVSVIEDEAFAGCVSLREINTPQPLSAIGAYAFDRCTALRAFSLKASISTLGEGAFRNCASLTAMDFTPTFSAIPDELCKGCISLQKIEFPSTVMSVGASAFEGCISAKAILADRSMQSFGARAFYGCRNVASIVCLTATPPACQPDTFGEISPLIPVTVPAASVADYQQAGGWNRFLYFIGQY